MKRFCAVLNDGSYVNVEADRMDMKENAILVWNGQNLVAYIDVSCVLCAHLSERSPVVMG